MKTFFRRTHASTFMIFSAFAASLLAFIMSLSSIHEQSKASHAETVAVQSDLTAKDIAKELLDLCVTTGGCQQQQLDHAAQVVQQPAPPQPAPSIDWVALRDATNGAVASYCAAHDGCRGKAGEPPNFDAVVASVLSRVPLPKDGSPGEPGKDGAAGDPGKDAKPITNAQIADSVTEYCEQPTKPCVGIAGPPGPAGPMGPAGKDGKDGSNGKPPQGWVYTDTLGIEHTCTRDANSLDSAPTYTCS